MVNIFSRPSAKVLALSGTQVPKFERSAFHAGSRMAVKPINDVLAIEDPDGLLWAKFSETKAGKDIIASLKDYVLFALDNEVPPSDAPAVAS